MEQSADFSLDKLGTYREGNRLEAKSARGGLPISLWETYSAFANSDGGMIVLGVKERKDGSFFVEGLTDAAKLIKDFWNMANNRQKISCNILTERMVTEETVDGKNIVVIKVPRAERTTRPVYVGLDPKLGSYRRNGEGDYHCTADEVSLMLRDASLVTEDNKLLKGFGYDAFNKDTVRRYRRLFELHHDNHVWNDEEDEVFLRRIGAMREDREDGKFYATGAGLLMFGHEYEIINEFPQYFLDYQENRSQSLFNRWTDRVTSQAGEWSGNVLDFILMVVPKLQAELKVPVVLKGNTRDEDTPLHKLIREAMVNMLSNADFYGRRGVVVHKNANGFSFANPGSMRVSVKDAVNGNISDPRNGVMLRMLSLIRYGERAGSGLQGIFKTWEKVYHSSPRIEVATDGVDRTTLYLDFNGRQPDIQAMLRLYDHPEEVKFEDSTQESKGENTQETDASSPESSLEIKNSGESIQESIQETQSKGESIQESIQETPNRGKSIQEKKSNAEKVVELLRIHPMITLSEVAARLALSRIGVQKITDRLKADGRLKREGSTKAGRWVVLD